MAGDVMENLFYQLVTKLKERGHISYANLFVDGTKIEANANRYSFVWEKTVTKNEAKMDVQIQMKLLELQTEYEKSGHPSWATALYSAECLIFQDRNQNKQLR